MCIIILFFIDFICSLPLKILRGSINFYVSWNRLGSKSALNINIKYEQLKELDEQWLIATKLWRTGLNYVYFNSLNVVHLQEYTMNWIFNSISTSKIFKYLQNCQQITKFQSSKEKWKKWQMNGPLKNYVQHPSTQN